MNLNSIALGGKGLIQRGAEECFIKLSAGLI